MCPFLSFFTRKLRLLLFASRCLQTHRCRCPFFCLAQLHAPSDAPVISRSASPQPWMTCCNGFCYNFALYYKAFFRVRRACSHAKRRHTINTLGVIYPKTGCNATSPTPPLLAPPCCEPMLRWPRRVARRRCEGRRHVANPCCRGVVVPLADVVEDAAMLQTHVEVAPSCRSQTLWRTSPCCEPMLSRHCRTARRRCGGCRHAANPRCDGPVEPLANVVEDDAVM